MSKKRKKKSPLRNEFTDALNVEMAERKIIERTQPKVEEPKISLEKISVEKVEVAKIPTEKIETPKIKIEKISIEKVEEIPAPPVEIKEKLPIVEVKVDAKLEKRILKEADNTISETKPKISAPKKTVFRSKTMQRWEDEEIEEKTPPLQIEIPQLSPPRKLSHPEKFGGVASIVMLVYAFVNLDKPLFFLAMALFANFLRYPIGSMFGKHSDDVSNALHTFSIVVFFGAILFLFTD